MTVPTRLLRQCHASLLTRCLGAVEVHRFPQAMCGQSLRRLAPTIAARLALSDMNNGEQTSRQRKLSL